MAWYLDLKSKFKSRNLYHSWFDFYKEWKSVRLEYLTSTYLFGQSTSNNQQQIGTFSILLSIIRDIIKQ